MSQQQVDRAVLDPAEVDFRRVTDAGRGLVAAVVQDADTLAVLMVGWMDAAALEATQATGRVTFWSRSRGEQWVKGETSGNTLDVVSVHLDCDADAVLVVARPAGPTCHTGAVSCFDATSRAGGEAAGAGGEAAASEIGPADAPASEIGHLARTIAERHRQRPAGSYTTSLFEGGTRRIAQKVGEEGVETALAGVAQGDEELLGESADLLYHLVVLLTDRGLSLADVEAVLRSRRG
ncbi:bifunctional phosphoribosyl-AMP cyclohydrolase/phosphoribosyl-ATP diphosphatase HisIE [Kytococcus sedentarius]|uniref:bifunctional phosphoribosyl-AMP cyclohydrolase/phosphoribosyl-ATP diphosphatase HisIE n=1 Tax=Kytococcus sedentarius TaxID=1276 RepID=UPI00194F04FD|nr:bifunctional phosphoribosyl-AMP cyclohydrolase/phosphoribosyl-ATP diphosphatase HisIE [Kytococcus sedentarius]QRO88027.1 bifunctional phosphoribosyl-AMP cyclohydrolase/phosphoribosyl-ATP diphosphatase HisIE [Kytococcus sedentarius]